MRSGPDNLDLTALPLDVRAVIEAERQARAKLEAEAAALSEQNQRLEHLVREFRQALHGKRSEKLGADARQLAFEDLETAVAAVEAAQEVGATPSAPRRKAGAVRRNLGRLPRELPRVERVIEPESLLCPCGCRSSSPTAGSRSTPMPSRTRSGPLP